MFIEAENIRKSYGRKTTVLNGASFHAASGEYIAIVGANGCGKSTLLEILAGSLKAGEKVFFTRLSYYFFMFTIYFHCCKHPTK